MLAVRRMKPQPGFHVIWLRDGLVMGWLLADCRNMKSWNLGLSPSEFPLKPGQWKKVAVVAHKKRIAAAKAIAKGKGARGATWCRHGGAAIDCGPKVVVSRNMCCVHTLAVATD
jgi:hypothetical protein